MRAARRPRASRPLGGVPRDDGEEVARRSAWPLPPRIAPDRPCCAPPRPRHSSPCAHPLAAWSIGTGAAPARRRRLGRRPVAPRRPTSRRRSRRPAPAGFESPPACSVVGSTRQVQTVTVQLTIESRLHRHRQPRHPEPVAGLRQPAAGTATGGPGFRFGVCRAPGEPEPEHQHAHADADVRGADAGAALAVAGRARGGRAGRGGGPRQEAQALRCGQACRAEARREPSGRRRVRIGAGRCG